MEIRVKIYRQSGDRVQIYRQSGDRVQIYRQSGDRVTIYRQNKGNNKITELRTILQREIQNS